MMDTAELKRLASDLRENADLDELEGCTAIVVNLERDAAAAILELIGLLEAKEAEVAELRTARDYNARQCLQMQDEILAQGVILRNTTAAINDQEREIHALCASREADIERAIRLAIIMDRESGKTFEESIAAVKEQMEGTTNG